MKERDSIMAGPYARIAMHAGAACAFVFVLQRFVLNQPLETNVLWAFFFAAAAAGLAWTHGRR